ncbi:MAG TPA: response regulator transcription factor [Bryobacteraceae bacterium]|nr:response regulator transcription factor [Bryobacteraceae bacterium]
MSAGRILVVDDEPQMRRIMLSLLSAQGYEVTAALTGEEALEKVRAEQFDLVLLDVNMPGMGGMEACRELRRGSDIGIIMLTVRDSERDKVDALDAGADDYITKPFGSPELLARIRATLRRSPTVLEAGPQTLQLGDVKVDFQSRHVQTAKGKVHLTPKQFDLLRYLAGHPNKAVSHRELLQAVWGPDYGDQIEYLRVFVNQLRKKIEPQPGSPRFLLTEPWVGYRLVLPQ